jgi:hypothetical protein
VDEIIFIIVIESSLEIAYSLKCPICLFFIFGVAAAASSTSPCR